MKTELAFSEEKLLLTLPDGTDVLKMEDEAPLAFPREKIARALCEPIGSLPLARICTDKLNCAGDNATACIVVSDNTRPVPYSGENGLISPILETLVSNGIKPENILILIATGTHAAMSESAIDKMLGTAPKEYGVCVKNHDCRDEDALRFVGTTERGTRALISKAYLDADIKILTGLVESHFMAGASGGRKSICPGIFGEKSAYVFHGAELMSDENARDLITAGNPVHEESLAVARLAGADFIVNVTLNARFEITGVFAGDLEMAHAAAVEQLKRHVVIPVAHTYDVVITHGGFVARNHYQAAKAGVAAINALSQGGSLIMAANNIDANPVGSNEYRACLLLLKLFGSDAFERLLKSPDWHFIKDQWQVQMWAKLFRRIDMNDFCYYAPQLDSRDWRDLMGVDGTTFLERAELELPALKRTELAIQRAADAAINKHASTGKQVSVAVLADGPYGIPGYV